jgi:isochorismate synthase
MDIVFTEPPVGSETTGQWSLSCNYAQLQSTLHRASEQATYSGHTVLASFTQPISPCDPLSIFRAFHTMKIGNSFFWARPSEMSALVGVGATTTIETSGSTPIANAAERWRKLQQNTIIGNAGDASRPTPGNTDGPLLFGGFSFDPHNPDTALWKDFPDGLLVLPYLLFHCDEHNTALTVNILVQPSSDIEQIVAEINAHISDLNVAVTEAMAQPLEAEEMQDELVVQDYLPAATWMKQVRFAVQTIKEGTVEKVVLARGVQVEQSKQVFDIASTLQRLRTSYPTAYVFAIQRGRQYFMGATPERLICGAGGQIQTMALAGSAPRGTTEEEDQRIGNELLQSLKNQGEHQVVVSTIHNSLAAICSRVWVADAPHLLKLKNIQHLQTPISGDLLPGRSILDAIEDLHPTPAVGGSPRLPALKFIREHEQLDRGWYAGPIGWIGTKGNGEFAVALRSGLVEGKQAMLFAGCGIVADSEPESEYAESCLKLQVMLRGLGREA